MHLSTNLLPVAEPPAADFSDAPYTPLIRTALPSPLPTMHHK